MMRRWVKHRRWAMVAVDGWLGWHVHVLVWLHVSMVCWRHEVMPVIGWWPRVEYRCLLWNRGWFWTNGCDGLWSLSGSGCWCGARWW